MTGLIAVPVVLTECVRRRLMAGIEFGSSEPLEMVDGDRDIGGVWVFTEGVGGKARLTDTDLTMNQPNPTRSRSVGSSLQRPTLKSHRPPTPFLFKCLPSDRLIFNTRHLTVLSHEYLQTKNHRSSLTPSAKCTTSPQDLARESPSCLSLDNGPLCLFLG